MPEPTDLLVRQVQSLTAHEVNLTQVLAVCSSDCARSQSDDETGRFEPPCDCGAVDVQAKLGRIAREWREEGGSDER